MKIQHLILFALLLVATACGKSSKTQFGTPEETFATLQEAIKNKDLTLYEQCWDPERKEKEGSVSQLRDKEGLWEELQGIFKGPQTLGDGNESVTDDGRTKKKFEITAPEAEQGGIGAITMVKNGDKWQMYSW